MGGDGPTADVCLVLNDPDTARHMRTFPVVGTDQGHDGDKFSYFISIFYTVCPFVPAVPLLVKRHPGWL